MKAVATLRFTVVDCSLMFLLLEEMGGAVETESSDVVGAVEEEGGEIIAESAELILSL